MGDGGHRGLRCPFLTSWFVAATCRDYIEGEDDTEPWALSLARKCYDMPAGNLLHLPFSGGVWDQPEGLLELMQLARNVWFIFKYMPDNKIEWKSDHRDFIAQVNEWANAIND